MLKIANNYGNFDAVHEPLPSGYRLIKGKRLGAICKRLKVKYIPAVTSFNASRYGVKAVIGGVVVTRASAPKILDAVAKTLATANDPSIIAKKKKAKEYRERKKEEFCQELGLHDYSQRLGRAVRRGDIDRDLAELLAFKAKYRHEYSDYDEQYTLQNWQSLRASLGFDEAKEVMREEALANKTEDPIPDNWDEYLSFYGFVSPQAIALAKTLQDPKRCHPTWFKEAEIAIRRDNLPLDQLKYEGIRQSIDCWRSARNDW